MLLQCVWKTWAFALIGLFTWYSGHALRMPEPDPNSAVPPDERSDRRDGQLVQVTIRNRINLGAPLVMSWPNRSPPQELLVEDGAVAEASLAIGETASFSAGVEALVDVGGGNDPFGATDPYGDGGYDSYTDYGKLPLFAASQPNLGCPFLGDRSLDFSVEHTFGNYLF